MSKRQDGAFAERDRLIRDLFVRYGQLMDYCDTFFGTVRARAGSAMVCGDGCGSCCELSSVTALEAAVMWKYVRRRRLHVKPLAPRRRGVCVFLENGRCTVYPVRPMICRSHGLPIVYKVRGRDTVCWCPKNFRKMRVRDIPKSWVFDGDAATVQLVKMNLAYCLVTGKRQLADRRVTFRSIRTGKAARVLA